MQCLAQKTAKNSVHKSSEAEQCGNYVLQKGMNGTRYHTKVDFDV